MKPVSIKTLTCLIAFVFISVGFFTKASAQERPGKEAFKELKSQLENFKNTDIMPNLKTWKTGFDSKLNAADLAKLNDLREKASVLRKQMMKEMQDKMASRAEGEKIDKDAMKEFREKHRDEMMKLMEALKPIVDNNKDAMAWLKETAGDKPKLWKEKAEQIIKDWKSKHSDLPGMGKGEKPMMSRKGMMDFGKDKKKMVAHFLLWNGTDEFQIPEMGGRGFGMMGGPGNGMMGKGMQGNGKMGNGKMDMNATSKTYPNPFKDKTTISFVLPQAGQVKVTMSDRAGNRVIEVFNGNLSAGNQAIEIDAEKLSLKTGVYIYKIESGKFSSDGKILFEK